LAKVHSHIVFGRKPGWGRGPFKVTRKRRLTIAQHPDDAEMAEMPNAAIHIDGAEYILRTTEIFEATYRTALNALHY
jgi:two-component system chemotaxis response regulator CheB